MYFPPYETSSSGPLVEEYHQQIIIITDQRELPFLYTNQNIMPNTKVVIAAELSYMCGIKSHYIPFSLTEKGNR